MNNFGCVNNTIRLRSGRYFDLAHPDPATIDIEDIAGALAKECRFGNQTSFFYSVAEHSILCAYQACFDELPVDCQFACLMHDAAEAFIGDLCRPLKIMLPDFRKVESAVSGAVGLAFGIDFDRWHDEIKKIDNEMVIAEKKRVFTPDSVVWTGEETVRVLEPRFKFLPCGQSESWFLQTFDSLQSLRKEPKLNVQ